MEEQLTKRLDELRTEFNQGKESLFELEEKRRHLQETLLRISGAIQVLEESLKKEIVEHK